jgi:dTDP-4-dehydrorhamnose reductase
MQKLRILILGATGMLGHRLVQQWGGVFEIAATLRTPVDYPFLRGVKLYTGVQGENALSVLPALKDFTPDVVVNCIGVIKQREEAKNAEASIAVNSLFPHVLARLCGEQGTRLIHLSTDCVFSGTKGAPYLEEDFADAHDIYGLSKYMGEVATPHCLTLRTSIIGRELKEKQSLVEWILRQKGQRAKGYAHALYTGFTTHAMGYLIANIITDFPDLHGLYHASSDAISKYELLKRVNEAYNLDIEVEKDEIFRCDRRLDSQRLRKITGCQPPSWEAMIARMMEEENAENY